MSQEEWIKLCESIEKHSRSAKDHFRRGNMVDGRVVLTHILRGLSLVQTLIVPK